MTSRERILATIAHTKPDRIPIDLGSTPSSGISGIAYAQLRKHLGMANGHTRVYDVVQQLAQPEDEILNRFNIDVRRRLDILAPGGGFVFNTIHNILPDVPPENIVAMYEAVEEVIGKEKP